VNLARRLTLNGVTVERLARAVTLDVEAYRVTEKEVAATTVEGHVRVGQCTVDAAALGIWWNGTRLVIARIAVCGALLGWWFAAASATYGEAHYALEWGSDFAGEQWRTSELLDWTRHEGAKYTLYSNWPAAVYFHLHRPARELPKEHDAATLAAFADTVRARNGRVVLFNVETSEYAPTASLLASPKLKAVAQFSDGVVLSASP